MLKNIMRRTLSYVMIAAMLIALLPNVSFASAETPTAYVTIENTTYTAEGAKWTGQLIDMYPVALEDGDTAMSIAQKAVEAKEYTQTGMDSGYVTEINGLSASDGGSQSGWMGTLNDWFTSSGLNSFYVSDGDVVKFMYTSNGYGEDLGGSWSNNDKTLKSLTVNTGRLDKEFSSDVTEYTLTVPYDTECIRVTPTASNKNFQTRIYKNAEVSYDEVKGPQITGEADYKDELNGSKKNTTDLTEKLGFYKRTQDIPVSDGDVITVGCGLDGWATMNAQAGGTSDSEKGQIYKLNIKFEDTAEFLPSDELYSVTVKAAPSDANVRFYTNTGFDENGYDVLDKAIKATDEGVEVINEKNSYHVYKMQLPKGTYSYRATDKDGKSLGGMTFDIPLTVNVDGTGGGECEVYLRQVGIYSTTQFTDESEQKYYATTDDFYTKVIDADGKIAQCGDSYLDDKERTVYSYMLYAGGNAELYTYQLIPTAKRADDYGINTMLNRTVSTGTTALTASGTLPTLISCNITAPTDATVTISHQIKNFYNEDVAYKTKEDNADNTSTYTFRVPKSGSGYRYRVQMDGKITKAGYLDLSSEEKAAATVTFADDENPKVRPEYDRTTTLGKRMEDSVLLNINSQNYLRMNSDDTFKVRAYRAAWQIIDSDTANMMIEPDFHYEIVSGDSVTLKQDGQNAVLTAVKPGVSVVKVTYDAIEIGGKTNYTGIYGAIDPSREGMFVVNVDGDVQTKIDLNTTWDSEFDTVYFTGDNGTFTFEPKADAELNVSVGDTAYAPDENGKYTVKINEGNNIIKVAAGDAEEYLVVKGGKLKVNITNVTNPEQPVKQGDTVSVSFDGLHMPVPKFSGIYNPGFGGTMKVAYKTSDGGSVSSKGTQYDFISNHALTFTVWDEGTYKLTDGYIPMSSMGSQFGAHRNLTDTGIGANFNASAVAGQFSTLPEVDIEVAKNDDLSYLDNARSSYCNLSSVNILDGSAAWLKLFSIANTTEKTANKKITTATFGTYNEVYPFTVTAVPANSAVNMEFRYWEEGDTEKHIYPLKAGEALELGTGVVTGEKTLYMEIAVTPKNPIYGKGEVYTYIVYKTNGAYARGVLQKINVKDIVKGEDDTESTAAFESPYGILYSTHGKDIDVTQNEYYTYVPADQEKVVIGVEKLIGTNNVTVNGEEKEVMTKEVEYSPITLAENETAVTIKVADDNTPREYKLNIIKKSELELAKINAVEFLNDTYSYVKDNVTSENVLAKADVIKESAIESVNAKESAEDVLSARNDGYTQMMLLTEKTDLDLAKESAAEYINSAYTELSEKAESEMLEKVTEIKDKALLEIAEKTTAEDIDEVKTTAYNKMSAYANAKSNADFDIDGDEVNFQKYWKADGKIIISANTSNDLTVNIFVAKYENDVMTGIVVTPVELKAGDNMIEAECAAQDGENTAVFIWDSTNLSKPYTKTIR